MHPTPDDDAVASDVKRLGGHMTLADAIRVALRRYRTDLHKDARAAGVDLQAKAGG